MEEYEILEVEIISFESTEISTDDVIATSGEDGDISGGWA